MLHISEKILGFLVDVSPPLVSQVKQEIVKAIQVMDHSERAYIYQPDDLEIPRWPGRAVNRIMNSNPIDHVASAIKNLVYLLANEDMDAEKHAFVILDTCDKHTQYGIQKILKIESAEDYGFSFHLCNLGDRIPQLEGIANDYQQANFHHFESVEWLALYILNQYREHDPFFSTNYDPLDLSNLKEEYDNLKEECEWLNTNQKLCKEDL